MQCDPLKQSNGMNVGQWTSVDCLTQDMQVTSLGFTQFAEVIGKTDLNIPKNKVQAGQRAASQSRPLSNQSSNSKTSTKASDTKISNQRPNLRAVPSKANLNKRGVSAAPSKINMKGLKKD